MKKILFLLLSTSVSVCMIFPESDPNTVPHHAPFSYPSGHASGAGASATIGVPNPVAHNHEHQKHDCTHDQTKKFRMPSAEVLQKRFVDSGIDLHADKIGIVKKLVGKEKTAAGVYISIGLAIIDYCDALKSKSGLPEDVVHPDCLLAQASVSKLIEAFLRNYPDALSELQEHGHYDPAKE